MAESETMDEARQRVVDTIIRAFDGVGREGGVSLHEADVIDDYGTDEQRAAARALDTESRWQDVPSKDIEQYDWILSFLDPKGFRYYLPAYMVWALRFDDTSESNSAHSLLFHLGHDGIERRARFQLLTHDQSVAVCAFLRYMRKYGGYIGESNRALNDYWGRFCSD